MAFALEISDLVKRYPTGTEALKGVSLTIEEGEFFGLLGPNGAPSNDAAPATTCGSGSAGPPRTASSAASNATSVSGAAAPLV